MAYGRGSNNSGHTGGLKGDVQGSRRKRETAKAHSRRSSLGKSVKGKKVNYKLVD
jgi:hypothetical protein